MKPRIKKHFCSSSSFFKSKMERLQELQKWHDENIEEIQRISSEIIVVETKVITHKKAYVKVFGELMQITLEEAKRIEQTMTIIYK